MGIAHNFPPDAFHSLISLWLNRQLSVNILTAKNWFQIQPCSLTGHPFIQYILRHHQLSFPGVDAIFERFLVRRERHTLRHHNMVIQELTAVVTDFYNVCPCFLVSQDLHYHRSPFTFHFVQSLDYLWNKRVVKVSVGFKITSQTNESFVLRQSQDK